MQRVISPVHSNSALARSARRRLSAAFLLCFLAGPAALAAAAPADRARLEQLRGQIQELQRDIERTHGERDQTRTDLRATEREAAEATAALRRTEAQLKAGDARLAELGAEQARAQHQLDRARDGLARQVRAAYATGRQEYLKLLLNQEDPATVSRTLTYYQYVARARADEIAQINATLTRLETLAGEIDAGRAELERLREGQLAYRQQLTDTHKKRAEILARLEADLKDKASEIGRLRADAERLDQLMQGLSQVMEDVAPAPGAEEKFSQVRGRLRLPASGPIGAHFGALKDGGPLLWQGLLIEGREGEDVRAVFRGRVAYAEWFGGLGLLLILDHGDGYMSLYGHNQVIYTEVGDWVETGQKIASMGNSGGRRAAGLYFEIRHNGEPRDPLQWCPERLAARP